MVNPTPTNAVDRWQPIAKVTKHRETKVDLWVKWWDADSDTFKGRRYTNCYWNREADNWRSIDMNCDITGNVKVTHWRYLPNSPETEAVLDAPKAPPAPTLPDPMEVPPEYRTDPPIAEHDHLQRGWQPK